MDFRGQPGWSPPPRKPEKGPEPVRLIVVWW